MSSFFASSNDSNLKVFLPPVRIELTTPSLRDQCSTTELKRLLIIVEYVSKFILKVECTFISF